MYTINPNFITYLKSRQRSENTIKAYVKNINSFLDYIKKSESEVTPFDVMDWMESMSNHSSATVAQALSSVKAYFDFLFTFEIIEKDPTARIKPPKVNNKPKHYMDADMVRAMIKACKTARDRAIVTMLGSTGVRISELVSITLKQYQEMKDNGNDMIKIVGKGNKARLIPINEETQTAIDDYLKARVNQIVNCDKLFLSFQGNEIARNNLSATLKAIAKRADIPFWNEISPHCLRSACASIYAEKGVPLGVIRDLLGHSSISTTGLYIKTNVSQVEDAVMNYCFN